MVQAPSRRDRVRAATVEEIKTTARRLLVADGPEAVSLRAIGRAMGMTAPALYRYFGNREELIKHVIADIFSELADDLQALEVAAEAGKWMGRGMALPVDTLNPQLITLGSLAVALGDRVLAPARRVVAEEALPQAVAACEIVPAKLGKRIGDVAALMAALTEDTVRARLGLE